MSSPGRQSPTRKTEPESWLLRLFESEFFDSRLALTYLFRYPDNVGIHHYVCQELKKFPEEEIEFLLPQICHIMISRPNDSAEVEDFIMDRCQVSSHLAILTLWYLESYLNDMQQNMNVQTEGFVLVKRLYQRCQTIIFSETQQNEEEDDIIQCDGIDVPKSAHAPAALVGVGLILAGLAAPMAFSISEKMIKTQARQPRFYDPFDEEDESSEEEDTKSVDSAEKNRKIERWRRNSLMSRVAARIPTSSPSLQELSYGSAFSFHHYLKKTSTYGSGRFEKQPSSASVIEDQITGDLADKPSISLDLLSRKSSVVSLVEDQQLVNSHYFHSEIQFLMALIDISERLVSFPKHIRQSSLIAELTLLNHNLPAKVCIPFVCPCTSINPHHHQIVRIALSDCVVLNSAERVPFLICVEVIDNGAENVRRISVCSRSPSTTQPPKLPISKEQSAHDAEYHQTVLSRRESAIKNHQVQQDNSGGPVEVVTDEFSEKMRTAAVMLAQLYQQQLKETSQLQLTKKPLRFRSATASSYNPPKTPHVDIPQTSFSTPATPATDQPPSKLRTDFELIRKRVLEEMAASEAARLAAISNHQNPTNEGMDELISNVDEQELTRDDDDPSASVFREAWEDKKKRIREASPYGSHPNWQLYSVIVKSGADLRQEQLALQLIYEISRIWEYFNISIWVYNFRILITSDQSGLIETIPDSMSIHSIKKQGYQRRLNQPGIMYTLYDHFISQFGHPGSEKFERAQDNFIKSLAGYSIICYLLQIKDRHNGNILLDLQGHLTHIDFGFMLMNSPGSVGFELAPFKLPQEYIDVMGGYNSPKFQEFRELVKVGFLALRKRSDGIVGIVEVMEKDSRLPCFTGVTNPAAVPLKVETKYTVTQSLRERFHLTLTDEAFCDFIDELIDSSCNNVFTKLYDTFQYYANGIL